MSSLFVMAPGLSPRVRGNLNIRPWPERVLRSIPARAGNRLWSAPRCLRGFLYPRACGEQALREGASPGDAAFGGLRTQSAGRIGGLSLCVGRKDRRDERRRHLILRRP